MDEKIGKESENEGIYHQSREMKLEEIIESTLYRTFSSPEDRITFLKNRYESMED